MSAADHPTDDRPPAAEALIAQQMAVLTRLTEIGMEIAEAAGRAAVSEPGAHAHDPALAFARAARAVRLTIALQSRLAKELTALGEAETRARAAEASRRRDRIHRRIERAAEGDRPDGDAVERLSSEAWERLTETDDADILDLPMHEVVARICADLGLAPDRAASAFPPPERLTVGETGPDDPVLSRLAALPRPRPRARGRPPNGAADEWISRSRIPS